MGLRVYVCGFDEFEVMRMRFWCEDVVKSTQIASVRKRRFFGFDVMFRNGFVTIHI